MARSTITGTEVFAVPELAVTETEPLAIAVTFPLPSTVAMRESLEFHSKGASSGSTEKSIGTVSPTANLILSWLIVIVTSSGSGMGGFGASMAPPLSDHDTRHSDMAVAINSSVRIK